MFTMEQKTTSLMANSSIEEYLTQFNLYTGKYDIFVDYLNFFKMPSSSSRDLYLTSILPEPFGL